MSPAPPRWVGNGSRNLPEERSGLNQNFFRRLRRIFGWIWRTDESGGGEGRAVLVRVLIAIVWLPIQVTLSLLFATGGMFLLLILGMVLAPFIGGFFLIRHLVRSSTPDVEEPVGPADPSGRSESGRVSWDISERNGLAGCASDQLHTYAPLNPTPDTLKRVVRPEELS